ncbi:MAG: MFS transporter, partial [Chloroflexota bacterium]
MSGFTTLILDYFSGDELNRFLGYQGAFIGLGGMLFLLIAGFLAELGWEYPFLIHLFAFILIPGVIIAIQEPENVKANQMVEDAVRLPWGKLWPIFVTAFIGMVVFFIFPVQIPFYLAEGGDVTTSQVGLALSINTLASIFFALTFQWLKSRLSFKAIFAIIFATFALNHLIVSFSSTYLVVMIGLIVGGAGIGLFPPNNAGWLAAMTPAAVRGKAVGLMTSVLFLGQFFSPILTQPVVNRFGLSGMFGVASGLAFLIAIIFSISNMQDKVFSNSYDEQFELPEQI